MWEEEEGEESELEEESEEEEEGESEDEGDGEEEPFDFDSAHAAGSEPLVVGAALAQGVVVPQGRRIEAVPTGRPVFTDMQDGVTRCGVCGWELVGCMC
jgi:hypothetical protein